MEKLDTSMIERLEARLEMDVTPVDPTGDPTPSKPLCDCIICRC